MLDFSELRMIGKRLADKAGASETLKVIMDPNKGYAEIFDTAAKEIGKDALIAGILEGPPEWSQIALLYFDDLGSADGELRKRVAEMPIDQRLLDAGPIVSTKIETTDSNIMGPLGFMQLHNAMAATCQWTIQWMHNSLEQPGAAYPDSGDWEWSEQITAGCSSGPYAVSKFTQKVPKAPIQNGDTVWIYIKVMAGTHLSSEHSRFQFTYNSGSRECAYWNASGTTTIHQLSLTDYKEYEDTKVASLM